MDSTLLYADSLLRQPNTRFTVVVNAPLNSCSPLNSPRSPPASPTKSHFDFTTNIQPIDSNKKSKAAKQPSSPNQDTRHKSPISIQSLMKRSKIFTKLIRALTLKDVTGSGNKTYPRDFRAKHASAKRKRARSSQSSGLSYYEPSLPTIIEEESDDLASIQSTIHHYNVYGTLMNQHQFVDAAA